MHDKFHQTKKSIRGLTLIEVLVALAIIAIALTAVIKAVAQTIRSTGHLQQKVIATWIAERLLNEMRLDYLKIPKEQANSAHRMTALGQVWYWRSVQTEGNTAYIKKIAIDVYTGPKKEEFAEEDAIVRLDSYLYKLPT